MASGDVSSKKGNTCLKLSVMLCFHVILFGALVGYCALGAVLFQALESPHEQSKWVNITAVRSETLDKFYMNAISNKNLIYQNDFITIGTLLLKDYEYIILSQRNYKGNMYGEKQLQWTFQNSFFYSFTVITTVGYGTITPSTTFGKIVTILYASMGIPLFLVFVVSTGISVAQALQNVCRWACGCCDIPDDIVDEEEERYRTLTVPKDETYVEPLNTAPLRHSPPKRNGPYCCPLFFLLLTLLGHMISGSIMLSLWEGWSYLDAFYFVFTSLTTIGFGDMVPGNATLNPGIPFYIYFVIGSTTVTGCFYLFYSAVAHMLTNCKLRLGNL